MAERANITVLHYTGAENDRGGIMSVVHALAGTNAFTCILGVNPGFVAQRRPSLTTLELPRIASETISPASWWRARSVARAVRTWLAVEPQRIFHGHSRAGLLTALHLRAAGETRVVVSVHCYGRQRWYYRRAAEKLGNRLFWLSPAMKRYYGFKDADAWTQCVPSCISVPSDFLLKKRRTGNGVVRLGGAGMLVAWKGWHLVLDALLELPASVREKIRFTHIGSAVDSAESRQYAAELFARTKAGPLAHVVAWRGEQRSSAALLEEIDALVVPSSAEPFSMAMLEALSAGVPVLASRAGGPSDVLSPPRNGWWFEPGNARDLARALTVLVETDALARVEIQRADLAPFSADMVARRWHSIYSALLGAA